MEATYRVNTQDLDVSFINSVKKLLPNQEIEIVISSLKVKKSEIEWANELIKSPSFDFLKETEEDIYSLKDGKSIL